MARMEINGNTYAVRDALKRLGARWDADRKVWWIDRNAFSGRQWQQISAEIYRMGLRLSS